MPTQNFSTELPDDLARTTVQQLVTKAPLIHCLTNQVVQNFTANLLLAAGAIPAMIVEPSEVVEFSSIAQGLLINVGTLTTESCSVFQLAAEQAVANSLPWVLDPVAVGGLTLRTEFCRQLLSLSPTVIRGNPSEIMVLQGAAAQGKGPDSQHTSEQALAAATALAQQTGSIVVITGVSDYITDGQTTYQVTGGSALATKVTGAGCALSALCAAFVSLDGDRLAQVATACWMMSRAADYAALRSAGPGSFAVHLLDGLSVVAQGISHDAV